MAEYIPSDIEKKWQDFWDQHQSNITTNDYNKEKYYVLEMLPYPSGNIHMGHVRNYTIGDVVARMKRAQGFNVLHPIGWDAFGLPAENAAIQNNVHPKKWTYENIAEMKKELKSIGLMYDWNREFATCDSDYYKHEQEFFIEFFKNNLVYKKESIVNWDPVDHTVLANEQVVDGCGWRSGAPVESKKLAQWFLNITKYSDELLAELKNLDWPEKVLSMQEKWIGKSEGMFIDFMIDKNDLISEDKLTVYTTRHDTLFGASFLAISFQHPVAEQLANNNKDIQNLIAECNKLGTAEEVIEKNEKKGVHTNLYVQHPLDSNKRLPVFIANFVLMNYGTGAVFGCPAHDQRDLDFARKYNLDVVPVIKPKDKDIIIEEEAYTGDGILFNSDFLNNLSIAQAKTKVKEILENNKLGKATTQYRLRDWGVSRQRYWGCPIPIINCNSCGAVPVNQEDLPVTLPDDVTFDKPGNPLQNHPTWKNVKCPKCGSDAERETDTLDTFFESSWYFLRYCDNETQDAINKQACQYWMPVDQYIGGVEHAVMHLLYARFFTKALRDCGYLNFAEPFKKLLTQGMICHATFKNDKNEWVLPSDVIKDKDGQLIHKDSGVKITQGRVEKMSKSKKNIVAPMGIIKNYGADTARLFMLSDSPPERDMEWSTEAIEGAWRFLIKLWNFIEGQKEYQLDKNLLNDLDDRMLELRKKAHKTINQVTEDINKFHLNKAVARIRELSNAIFSFEIKCIKCRAVVREALEITISLLYPMVPHITCQLWQNLGYKSDLLDLQWPQADDKLIIEDTVTIAVQINGKKRAVIEIPKDIEENIVKEKALSEINIQNNIGDKSIRKVIYVQNKIINIII